MKIFKSAKSQMELRIVSTNEDLVRFIIGMPDEIFSSIDISPDSIPALALAELEAAGYDDKADDMSQADSYVFDALHKLQQSVDVQELATAEAKEQAELEAEALELANLFHGTDWDFFPCNRTVEAQNWLTVARKARELAENRPYEEATNA